jgi:hypothetical protein
VNILALGLMALGVVLLLFGIFLFTKGGRITGTIFSLLGIVIIATPFLISLFLAR